MGLLRGEDGLQVPPSTLVATEYLPALQGRTWDGDDATALTMDQQRLIKRASIDIKIVRRESDESAKFDLFQRLNTGGSQLSDQEVRNCLLIMARPEYYRWLLELRGNNDFQSTVAPSDRAAAEQYDMELVLRFMLIRGLDDEGVKSIGDLSDFLDRESVREADAFVPPQADLRQQFADTFRIINEALGDQAFRRFDSVRSKFMGGFSVSAFEVVSVGVSSHLDDWRALEPGIRSARLTELVQQIWSDPDFRENSGSGIRANSRLTKTLPYARAHFAP
jgi:hypothetical protein